MAFLQRYAALSFTADGIASFVASALRLTRATLRLWALEPRHLPFNDRSRSNSFFVFLEIVLPRASLSAVPIIDCRPLSYMMSGVGASDFVLGESDSKL
jgi:hypothetical protein